MVCRTFQIVWDDLPFIHQRKHNLPLSEKGGDAENMTKIENKEQNPNVNIFYSVQIMMSEIVYDVLGTVRYLQGMWPWYN